MIWRPATRELLLLQAKAAGASAVSPTKGTAREATTSTRRSDLATEGDFIASMVGPIETEVKEAVA